MATPYSDVYNTFLGKITDYDLPKFTDLDKEEILFGFMKSACVKFNKVCLINLYDRDENLKQFNKDLDDEIIDIISELMVIEWLKPKMLSTENLKNSLTTADYKILNTVSLTSIKETYELCKKDTKSLINNYSFMHGDFKEIGGK